MFDDDTPPPSGERPASPPALNLRQVGWFLVQWWWLLVLCLALSLAGAFVYLARARPIYAATAVVKFEPGASGSLRFTGAADDEYRSDDIRKEKLKELQQLIQTRPLLARVIERNDLAANPAFRSGPQPLSPAQLTGRLRRMLHVELRPNTRLIDVTVEDGDPHLAAQLANAVVQELIRQDAESHQASSQTATAFLGEEAQRLQKQLTECDAKLQSYKDQALSLEQQQAVVGDSLRELNRQLGEARMERIRHESEYFPVRDLQGVVAKLLTVPRIASDPTVMALQASLAQQEVELANVRLVYKERHPTYLQTAGKLAELQQALSNATLQVAQTMRSSYENAMVRESTLRKELAEQEQSLRSLNTQSVPYNTLLRDREQYRALYDAVVKRMGETTMAGNFEVSQLQVFQPADVPQYPVKPRRVLVLAGAVAGAVLVGLLASFGWMLWDDSLKTLADAEHFLQLPVLSTIPRVTRLHKGRAPIVVSNEHPLPGAHSFRYLRTSMAINDPHGDRRTYLFTSAMPGEGKTFCALNFAASLAHQGLRTLLVDCDLQRPTLSKLLLGKNSPAAGVTDVLAHLPSEVRQTEIELLSFCSAGTPRAEASELLAQQRLTSFITMMAQQFDRVVLDTAPIFGVSDTLLLVGDVQAVCLVVRAGGTPREAVRRCVQTLLRANAPLTGVIMNAVLPSQMSIYGNPYYDYGYQTSKR